MRKILNLTIVCSLMVLLGCGPSAQILDPGGPSIKEAMSEPSTGNKMRIAVMNFENKTPYEVGNGMRDMLTSTLFRTGKFIVVERENLPEVLQELRLSSTGIIDPETRIPVGETESAELLIFGTVTDFFPAEKGVTAKVGGVQQSHVAIDLKIVSTRTSRILAATTVEGKATDAFLDTSVLKYVGMSPLYSLAIWKNTPIASAIRFCIDKAVDSVTELGKVKTKDMGGSATTEQMGDAIANALV